MKMYWLYKTENLEVREVLQLGQDSNSVSLQSSVLPPLVLALSSGYFSNGSKMATGSYRIPCKNLFGWSFAFVTRRNLIFRLCSCKSWKLHFLANGSQNLIISNWMLTPILSPWLVEWNAQNGLRKSEPSPELGSGASLSRIMSPQM